jgi:ABC-type lipoprotein export system ATPase subunit
MSTLEAPPDTHETGIEVHLSGVVHLYSSLEGEVVALRGIDLDIAAGESIALLGPSGAGKSTVLGLLAGEFAPSAGSVRIGEHDVGTLSADVLSRLRARDISLVVQGASANLLSYATALQNVWFAQHGARRRGDAPSRSATELLELFGLSPLADRRIDEMSIGERQRVALVAGVAVLPRLLLVDEPTSQLTSEERDQVIESILAIHREIGLTVIVVTHDAEVANRFERTVTIRDGRVGAEGRYGVEYAVVGRDGSLHLPLQVLDLLPPNSLVRVIRLANGVELRRADEQDLAP